MFTTFLSDGNLFYYMTIVPENEEPSYRAAFDRIRQQLRLTDVR
jgi:hypothetical protein